MSELYRNVHDGLVSHALSYLDFADICRASRASRFFHRAKQMSHSWESATVVLPSSVLPLGLKPYLRYVRRAKTPLYSYLLNTEYLPLLVSPMALELSPQSVMQSALWPSLRSVSISSAELELFARQAPRFPYLTTLVLQGKYRVPAKASVTFQTVFSIYPNLQELCTTLGGWSLSSCDESQHPSLTKLVMGEFSIQEEETLPAQWRGWSTIGARFPRLTNLQLLYTERRYLAQRKLPTRFPGVNFGSALAANLTILVLYNLELPHDLTDIPELTALHTMCLDLTLQTERWDPVLNGLQVFDAYAHLVSAAPLLRNLCMTLTPLGLPGAPAAEIHVATVQSALLGAVASRSHLKRLTVLSGNNDSELEVYRPAHRLTSLFEGLAAIPEDQELAPRLEELSLYIPLTATVLVHQLLLSPVCSRMRVADLSVYHDGAGPEADTLPPVNSQVATRISQMFFGSNGAPWADELESVSRALQPMWPGICLQPRSVERDIRKVYCWQSEQQEPLDFWSICTCVDKEQLARHGARSGFML